MPLTGRHCRRDALLRLRPRSEAGKGAGNWKRKKERSSADDDGRPLPKAEGGPHLVFVGFVDGFGAGQCLMVVMTNQSK